MMRIFVNGMSAKSGGGRSILTNFLKVARVADDPYHYVVAVPDAQSYAALASDRVEIVPLERASRAMWIPLTCALSLPRLARRKGCELVFNLSDIPICTGLPQVFLFDWSYAAFLDSPAWGLSTRKERMVRHAKLFFFKRWLCFIDIMIAQNQVLADRLTQNYGLKKVQVVPNAVSLDNLDVAGEKDFALGAGFKLLCLSRYYSHKNIESFLPLAERLRAEGLRVKIITTVSASDGPGAERFLTKIGDRGLGEWIVNLGTVPMEHVQSLYRQSDALILPTLLESFSGTYVEAMFHQRPILTSDLSFARAVCGAGAYYFNPNDTDEIFAQIKEVIGDPDGRAVKLAAASRLLEDMLTWEQAYTAYTQAFDKALKRQVK